MSNAELPKASSKRRRGRNTQAAGSQLAQGEPLIWLSGGALAVALCMIVGLLVLVTVQGAQTFWPRPVVSLQTTSGSFVVGEVIDREQYAQSVAIAVDEEQFARGNRVKPQLRRQLVRVSRLGAESGRNEWVNDADVVAATYPSWMAVIERRSGGRIYGEPRGYRIGDETTSATPEEAWAFFQREHPAIQARVEEKQRLEEVDLGQINSRMERARLAAREVELAHGARSEAYAAARQTWQDIETQANAESTAFIGQIEQLTKENNRFAWQLNVGGEQLEFVPLEDVLRAYTPNQMSLAGKWALYGERWLEFITEEPRAVNTEGGVMPAIFGTVAMTLIMSLVVAPFGVLASLYLREYAKSGPLVSLIRIAINNLSGVPSIVFGVFGFGFFCVQVGAFIDGGPAHARIPVLPPAWWYFVLLCLAIFSLLAFLASLSGAGQRAGERTTRQVWLMNAGGVLWVLATVLILVLIAMSPFFHGFYRASLPAPTFGTGGILWGALTLSLLTLPVVITATEEALSAVPNSLREGSYACGAGKWQTIRRIVLPHAMPGIMTGMILALSRGAGEVAPLMMVGAIKFAPRLPVDGEFPFVHAQRSFMHLAYHIFDLGFHSPDSESAKPTIYTTILLLIFIVVVLNLTAVYLRHRMRKAFSLGQF